MSNYRPRAREWAVADRDATERANSARRAASDAAERDRSNLQHMLYSWDVSGHAVAKNGTATVELTYAQFCKLIDDVRKVRNDVR